MPASEVPRQTYLSVDDEIESGPEEGEGGTPAKTEDEKTVEESGEGTAPREE